MLWVGKEMPKNNNMSDEQPAWVEAARSKWRYRGARRPDFAEAPLPGEESVWDYPRPPRVVPDDRLITVMHQGLVLAETSSAVRLLETASPPTFYIPRRDVALDLLSRSSKTSFCEWKGTAEYLSFQTGNTRIENCAWQYPRPFAEFLDIAGFIGFHPSKLDCLVEQEAVVPQPGGLYAGWITKEIRGPFKGEPGTEDW